MATNICNIVDRYTRLRGNTPSNTTTGSRGVSPDDILNAISRVNPTDVREIASEYLTKSPTLALVGPFKNEAKFEKVLRS